MKNSLVSLHRHLLKQLYTTLLIMLKKGWVEKGLFWLYLWTFSGNSTNVGQQKSFYNSEIRSAQKYI